MIPQSAASVGSGRVGSDFLDLGLGFLKRHASGWAGWGRVGSGRVRKSSNSHGSGPVFVSRPDPTRPARFDPTPVNSPGYFLPSGSTRGLMSGVGAGVVFGVGGIG